MTRQTVLPPVLAAPPSTRRELVQMQWKYMVCISDHGKLGTETHAAVRRYERLHRAEQFRAGRIAEGPELGGLLLAGVRSVVRGRMFNGCGFPTTGVERHERTVAADWAIINDLSYVDGGLVLRPIRRGHWTAEL